MVEQGTGGGHGGTAVQSLASLEIVGKLITSGGVDAAVSYQCGSSSLASCTKSIASSLLELRSSFKGTCTVDVIEAGADVGRLRSSGACTVDW